LRCERRQRSIFGAVVKQDLYALLGLLQLLLALTGQLHALRSNSFSASSSGNSPDSRRVNDVFQVAEGALRADVSLYLAGGAGFFGIILFQYR
jgi:hypothetical protein